MNIAEYERLSKIELKVYTAQSKGVTKYLVNCGTNGLGDTIHATEEAAEKEIAFIKNQMTSTKAHIEKEREIEAKEQVEREADVLHFIKVMDLGEGEIQSDCLEHVLETFTHYQLPLKWQRTRQNLSKAVLKRGKVVTIWKFNRTTLKAVNDMIQHVYNGVR